MRAKTEAWLADALTPENVLDTLRLASEANSDRLVARCVRFVLENRNSESLKLEKVLNFGLPGDVMSSFVKQLW